MRTKSAMLSMYLVTVIFVEQLPIMMWKSARCFRREISKRNNLIGLHLKPPLVSRLAN